MRFDLNDLALVLNGAAGAVDRYGRQQMLSSLGQSIKSGDYQGAANQALAGGDLNTGVNLLKLGQQQQQLSAQRDADAQALSIINGGAATPVSRATPGGNGKRIYDEAVAAGASPNEAALLASAAGAESNYNPAAVHDGGTGYGLFGHRLDRLDAMRKSAGGQTPTEQQQIAFALQELRNRPEGRLVASAKTPEELTRAQMFFERPRGFTPQSPERGDNYAGRLDLTRQYFPGQAQPVQVAGASGAVPIGVNDTDINALLTQKAGLLRALDVPNISQARRDAINKRLNDINFMITRSDRQEERAAREADRAELRALRKEQFADPGAKKLAEERAKNQAEMEMGRMQAARNAGLMIPQIDRARQAYEALQKLNAIGPISASSPMRLAGGVLGTEAEAARQEYEAAGKELELAKAQISMKGQGAITESERRILQLTLPRLDAARPETGLKTLKMWKDLAEKAIREGASVAPDERAQPQNSGSLPAGWSVKVN